MGKVSIWRVDTAERIAEFDEPTSFFWPSNIAWSPTKPVLASLSDEDRTVRLWRLSGRAHPAEAAGAPRNQRAAEIFQPDQLGHTRVDLYRLGNATSARMDAVRLKSDIETFIREAISWVRANSGGIATWDAASYLITQRGTLWKLPAGSIIGDALVVRNLAPGSWEWQPAYDMPLAEYVSELSRLNSLFVTENRDPPPPVA
jgi:hypothetical protein